LMLSGLDVAAIEQRIDCCFELCRPIHGVVLFCCDGLLDVRVE
jgi:hypothetical protein